MPKFKVPISWTEKHGWTLVVEAESKDEINEAALSELVEEVLWEIAPEENTHVDTKSTSKLEEVEEITDKQVIWYGGVEYRIEKSEIVSV